MSGIFNSDFFKQYYNGIFRIILYNLQTPSGELFWARRSYYEKPVHYRAAVILRLSSDPPPHTDQPLSSSRLSARELALPFA